MKLIMGLKNHKVNIGLRSRSISSNSCSVTVGIWEWILILEFRNSMRRDKMNTKDQKTLFVQFWRISSIFMILAMFISSIGVNPAAAQDIPNSQLANPAASDNFSVQNGPAFAPDCDNPPNEIVAENCKTGNPPSEWDISGAGDSSIQGFATDISVDRNETV